MKNFRSYLAAAAITAFFSASASAQCNTNVSACVNGGSSGPFNFVNPGSAVSNCLQWVGPNTAYIMMHITASGNLNMLINGNASTGYLDVAIFNIPTGQNPCTAIQSTSNQIGCNFASAPSGCNQFGTSFPCGSSVPAPYVTAGQDLMIVVENWSGASSTFTLSLAGSGAQAGPPNPAITPAGPFCVTSASVQLQAADMGGTWSGPGVSSSGVFNPASAGPGTHTINYSIGVAPCNATSSTTITVNSATVSVSPNQTICPGGSAALSASGAATYTWSPTTGLSPTTGPNVTASPATTTTYTVTGTTAGCNSTANVTVTVGPAPAVNSAPNQTYCSGTATTPVSFSGGAAGTVYNWTNSNPAIGLPASGSGTIPSFTAASGTATITVTPVNGSCTGTPITFTYNISGTNTTVSPNASICPGGSTPLTASGAANYTWSPTTGLSPTTGATVTASPATTTTYTVTGTTAAGTCPTTATITVTVGGSPAVNAVPNQSFCTGAATTPITFSGGGPGTTYNWTNSNPAIGLAASGTGNIPSFNPAVGTATITVTPVVGSCTGTPISFTITISGTNTTVSPNVSICAGSSTPLSASGAANFSWSPTTGLSPTSGPNVTATPSTTTTYTVTGTTAGGTCPTSATVTVTVGSVPTASNVGAQIYCAGMTTQAIGITGSAGATFDWTNSNPAIGLAASGTGNIPSFPATNTSASPVTATITVTPVLGNCTGNPISFPITINPQPSVIASNNGPLCEGAQIDLTASNVTGGTYTWSGPSGYGAGTQNTSIPNAAASSFGTYTVTVTAYGCSATATTNVAMIPGTQPAINPVGPFCENGAIVTLTATAPGGTWSGPGIIDPVSGAFDPSSASVGSNTITYTATSGCVNPATTIISINSVPNVQFSSPVTSGCVALAVTLTDQTNPPSTSVTWDFGDGSSSTQQGPVTHVYTTPGCYDVTLTTTTAAGCSSSATLANYICALPMADASFVVDDLTQTINDPTFQMINTSVDATIYNWDFGDGSGSNAVSPSHTYVDDPGSYTITLYADNAGGCEDSAKVTVKVEDELIFYIPNAFTPDGDEHNNTFQPVFYSGFDPTDYTLTIYNRWGEIIFESHDPKIGWDGGYLSTEGHVKEGAYTWQVRFHTTVGDEKRVYNGSVLLIR